MNADWSSNSCARWVRGACLFEREHHRRIAAVLEALNAPLLAANACLFGGGTAIAMAHGEYRESVDIDFLVSNLEGYRALRQLATGPQGLLALARPGAALRQLRELRADQYGMRTLVAAGAVDTAETPGAGAIKFEIVLEARITLAAPRTADQICGVATLSPLDMAASKLLANADRWADDSVFSRDLIDLAMLQPKRKLLQQAIAKARLAYGDGVEVSLQQAIGSLFEREGRLERCLAALQISLPKALVWQRIRAVAGAAGV